MPSRVILFLCSVELGMLKESPSKVLDLKGGFTVNKTPLSLGGGSKW
jgi:hypothetical protein